jgi:hypothetical protein
VDHFLVGYFFGGAGETRVASVGQQHAVAFGVSSQGRQQLPTL